MKTIKIVKVLVLFIILVVSGEVKLVAQSQNPAMIILPNRNIHIGREDGNSSNNGLLFGKGVGYSGYTDNNGIWGIEYYDQGLNFFKAWPTANAGNYFLYLRDDWGVGIGKRDPRFRLDVEGDIGARGVRLTSDYRLKKDISDLNIDVNSLLNLKTIRFKNAHLITSKEEIQDKFDKGLIDEIHYQTELATIESEKRIAERDTVTRFGVIAQDLKTLYPELVFEDSKGYLSVDYIGLIPVMIESIKSLQTQINNLQQNPVSYSISSDAVLYQNEPNPFNQTTIIRYSIPVHAESAIIGIYDLSGLQLQQFILTEKGASSISINANEFEPGIYLYTLLVDGQEIETRKMFITQ